MKKGLAVPYIIAIILGIIILAICVYLIYKAISGDKIDCQECKARLTTWCSICYLSGWDKDYELGEELSECVNDCGFWTGTTPDTLCDTNAMALCKGMGIPF